MKKVVVCEVCGCIIRMSGAGYQKTGTVCRPCRQKRAREELIKISRQFAGVLPEIEEAPVPDYYDDEDVVI